ncbi:heme-binding protein 2-like [Engystomops pustulosus]|uniref:heme-binding protein 2-like n=1 Tax=Engystomops pustulosus TaxID=76066 RepID=UPI003AFA8435
MHLSITSPVVVSFKLGYREPKTGTMSIFLSANLKNPPAPLNSNTFLQSYPKASLYVKSFGGIAKKEGYAKNIQALAEELTKLGLHFDHSFSACNIYDPPTKLSNRHNEVWFLATED